MLQAFEWYGLDSRSLHVRVHLNAEIWETLMNRRLP